MSQRNKNISPIYDFNQSKTRSICYSGMELFKGNRKKVILTKQYKHIKEEKNRCSHYR